MGKNKKQKEQKPSKNIFKVVGARTFKTKNKAKAVVANLKHLNELNRRITEQVNQQLDTLQHEVRGQGKKDEMKVEKSASESKRLIPKDIEKFKETEKKSSDALEQLSVMSV